MSQTDRPRRPNAKQARDRARPRGRDPRVDSSPPPAEEAVSVAARVSRPAIPSVPGVEPLPARIATLELEVERLQQQCAADADEIGAMLARVAELQGRIGDLEAQLERSHAEIVRSQEEARGLAETLETTTRRALMAERAASDGAEALERAHAELQADRARVVDLEAKLARVQSQHRTEMQTARAETGAAADAARREQAEAEAGARRELQRAAEEERSAAARARQQAAALEVSLAEARDVIARTTKLLDQVRRTLTGQAPPAPPAERGRKPPLPHDPAVDVVSLEELDVDLAEP